MKKIVDIFPQKSNIQEIEKKKKKPRFFSWLSVLIILIIIFSGLVFLSLNSKLDLKIKVQLEPVNFEESFHVEVGAENINLEEKVIPGRFFVKDFEKWKQFKSTGISQKTGKAKGKIRVYNTQTPPTPLTLRATTRFLSSEEGKIFRTAKKVYIPQAKIKGGKVVPGIVEVEVEVEAQEPGQDYNIGPSKFSVPGLIGASYYYSIWGESESPMSGGFREEIKIVSQEDIEKATNTLKEELQKEAKESLRSEMPQRFVLLEGAVSEEKVEIFSFQKPGQEAEEFALEGKIKIKGLGFKNSHLKELSEIFVRSQLFSPQKLLARSLKVKVLRHNLIIEQGKIVLDLKIEGAIYKNIPVEEVSQQVLGKSKKEIERIIFKSYPQAESTEIKIWPFWLKNAPKNSERIRVGLTHPPL